MKTKAQTNKLQKNSGVILPLGLVLTLFTIYSLLEIKTANASIPITNLIDRVDPYDFPHQVEIQLEQPSSEIVKEMLKKPQIDLVDEIIISDNPNLIEVDNPIEEIDEKNPSEAPIVFVEVEEPEDLDNDSHLLLDLVEEVPIYPGCEKGNKNEKKACLEKKIRRLVQRKFNGDLVGSLGLSSGNKNIYINFIITKTGDVEVVASRAAHIRLEKEGERVVRLLPKMKPGRQNGRDVNVSYMLPISVKVE